MAINLNREIVVIDDDQDMQDLVRAFFTPKGYKVTGYSDAESALQDCNLKGDSWDVVLSDLKLPKMSGVDLTVAIKKKYPQLPVILITTMKSAETAVTAVKKGVYDFIVKPIHFPQLQISVERALHLKDLNEDMIELRDRVRGSQAFHGNVIGRSPRFLQALDLAKRVAKSKANIFISGESGTGKEVFAKFIHQESPRAKGPFVAINCSAIPETLLESELFGHAKGAFTGAQDKKIGLFEEAENGTLFLDEIGDLSLSLQAKLLRVLQERKIKRVGENQARPINCRIISATHKNLNSLIQQGQFREDLYFRLNVIPIQIPPLRERREDLIPLAEFFLKRFSAENESAVRSFSKEALKYILENSWRGNVRELENTIERAVVLTDSGEIPYENIVALDYSSEMASALPAIRNVGPVVETISPQKQFVVDATTGLPQIDEVISGYIEFAVSYNNGARDKTAKDLGIDRKTLYRKLKSQEQAIPVQQ